MQQDLSTMTNPAPIATLYQRYAQSIFAYLRTHMSSREDAEDILLEVFLAALENGYFVTLPEQKQLAWLRQVARNKIVDYYRRSKLQQFVGLEQIAEVLYEEDSNLAPEQAVLQDEKNAKLRAVLRSMPPSQQEVLQLRFGRGMRCAEIATMLDKSEGSIRMLLLRALNYLRNIYID